MSLRLFNIWLLSLSLSVAWVAWPRGLGKREGELASVTQVKGKVSIRPAGSFSWSPVQVGSSLIAFDTIATASEGRAEITLSNGASLVLPSDTQVKIQAQSVIPGMMISLIKGGLEVQTLKRSAKGAGMMLAAAKPISIQTAHYNVDLSQLEGQFKLQDGAGVEATQPDSVRIQNPKGAFSLTDFVPNADEGLEDSVVEMPEETLPPPPLPKVKLPVKIPTPAPEAVPESSLPKAMPLVEMPEEDVELPQLKDRLLKFWAVESIEETLDLPLLLPLVEPLPSFDAERWQTIMRIRVKDSKNFIVIKREPGEFGLFFSLRELESILPSGSLDDLRLIVETGLMRRSGDQEQIRMADRKTAVRLQSLQNRQAVSVVVRGWSFAEPTDQWIRTTPDGGSGVAFHLMESLMLPRLEGYLRGARDFSVVPLHSSAQRGDVHFIRGQNIVATTNSKDEDVIKGLTDQLEPDLVYRGSHQAFLGGKGSFDLNKMASLPGEIYYVFRKRVLKLDRNLVKTHAAARSFLEKFDPYFMNSPVQIIYGKE